MTSVKVLGPGCTRCKQLEKNVKEAIAKLAGEFTVEKIEDYQKIAQYGILSTPGLVVNDRVISAGKVQTIEELVEILK